MPKDKKPTIIIDDAIDDERTSKMRRELLEWFDKMLNLGAIEVPRIPTTFRTPSVWEERELWWGIDYAANHSSDYTKVINPEGSHTASVLTPYHSGDLLKELQPVSITRGPAMLYRDDRPPDDLSPLTKEVIIMATRAECKFCGETAKVNRAGNFVAHGFARVEGVQRLDKKCKGSGMAAMKAAKAPFNDVRPCSECAMPVVIGADGGDGGKVLCIVCLDKIDKEPKFEKYGCCDCGEPITPEYFECENDAGWVLCELCKAKTPAAPKPPIVIQGTLDKTEVPCVKCRTPVAVHRDDKTPKLCAACFATELSVNVKPHHREHLKALDKNIRMCECGALIDVAKEGVPCKGCTVEKPCVSCGTSVTVAKEALKSFKVLCSTCYVPQPGDEVAMVPPSKVDKKDR